MRVPPICKPDEGAEIPDVFLRRKASLFRKGYGTPQATLPVGIPQHEINRALVMPLRKEQEHFPALRVIDLTDQGLNRAGITIAREADHAIKEGVVVHIGKHCAPHESIALPGQANNRALVPHVFGVLEQALDILRINATLLALAKRLHASPTIRIDNLYLVHAFLLVNPQLAAEPAIKPDDGPCKRNGDALHIEEARRDIQIRKHTIYDNGADPVKNIPVICNGPGDPHAKGRPNHERGPATALHSKAPEQEATDGVNFRVDIHTQDSRHHIDNLGERCNRRHHDDHDTDSFHQATSFRL
jgi:hypothetical protein